MIAQHIKDAILALVHVDGGATDADRRRVELALTGMRPHGATLRLAAAARMLGVHRNTVAKWARSGRLDPIYGSTGKRVVGVTEESLARV